MKHIIHRILFDFNQLLYMVENIEQNLSIKHIYVVFNSIYITILGASAIVITIKKEKIFGVSFDDYYNFINGKKCDNRLKTLFGILILMPVFNYIIFENFNINFIFELIIMFGELIGLCIVIRPLYLCITANEKYLKHNFSKKVGIIKYTDIKKHEISIAIVEYLLIKSDNNIDEVVKKLNNKNELDILYELTFIAMYRYMNETKSLTSSGIRTISNNIIGVKDKEKLQYYVQNINYASKVFFELCKKDKNDILADRLSTNFLIISNENFLAFYRFYYIPLLINAVVNSINNGSVETLKVIRLSILKSFHSCYPVEFINIIDSLLYSYIKVDSLMPNRIKNELINFIKDNKDGKSWDSIKSECRYYEMKDFDNYILAYGIKEYDLTYEPKVNKVITCHNDSYFRCRYYIIVLLYSNSLAINFIKNILANAKGKTYYNTFIYALNDIIVGNVENVDYILDFNKIRKNENLFKFNSDGIKKELMEINLREIMNKEEKSDPDVSFLHNKIIESLEEKFNALTINSNDDNKKYNLTKKFPIHFIIESDNFDLDENFISDGAINIISSTINETLTKNSKEIKINIFKEKYDVSEIKYIDPYLATKFENKFDDSKTKLNIDILFGNYIILNDFAIQITIDNVIIKQCIGDELDDYVNSFRTDNGLYNYIGKIYAFDGLKEYFNTKNHVYSIKIYYSIKYNEEDLSKILYINVD